MLVCTLVCPNCVRLGWRYLVSTLAEQGLLMKALITEGSAWTAQSLRHVRSSGSDLPSVPEYRENGLSMLVVDGTVHCSISCCGATGCEPHLQPFVPDLADIHLEHPQWGPHMYVPHHCRSGTEQLSGIRKAGCDKDDLTLCIVVGSTSGESQHHYRCQAQGNKVKTQVSLYSSSSGRSAFDDAAY